MSDELTIQQKSNALEDILKRLPAQLLMGASTLGAIAVLSGVGMPVPLEGLATSVGYGIFSALILDWARGKKLNDEDLLEKTKEALRESGVEKLLKERDFYHALSQLLRQISRQNQELRAVLLGRLDEIASVQQRSGMSEDDRKLQDELLSLLRTVQIELGQRANLELTSAIPAPKSGSNYIERRLQAGILKALVGGRKVGVRGLHGMGGHGKTELAIAVAMEIRHQNILPGGVLWVSLTERTVEVALGDIERALKLLSAVQEPLDIRARLVKERLSTCPALIILDDVQETHAKALGYLIPPAGCPLLVTTRLRNIPGLPANAMKELGVFTKIEAHRLLRSIIGTRACQAEPEALDTVARMCGYHALALDVSARLIAKRLASEELPIAAHVTRLSAMQTRLDALKFPDIQLNVETVLRVSYDALAPQEARSFDLLGVLAPAPFSREMAAALWQTNPDEALRILERLHQLSIIRVEHGRWSLHDLWYSFVVRRLSEREPNEVKIAFPRYVDYIIALTQDFEELPPEKWYTLELDLPHIDYIGEYLATHNQANIDDATWRQRALHFASHVTSYVLYRPQGTQTETGITLHGLNWLEMGLNIARQVGDQKSEADFLNSIGVVWNFLGDNRKALELHEQALPLKRALGDRGGEAAVLGNIGHAWHDLGERHKALEFYQQALTLAQEAGEESGEATVLQNIGSVWSELGEKSKALGFHNRALSLFQTVGDQRGEAYTLSNIGNVCSWLNEHRKALGFYQQALPLARAVGDQHCEATTLYNIGNVYSNLGEKQKALEFYEQSLPLRRIVGDRRGEAAILHSMGNTWHILGETQKALDFYQQALHLRQLIGDQQGEAETLLGIGGAWHVMGKKRRALEIYEQALPLAQVGGDQLAQATTLYSIGDLWSELGDQHKALELCQQALPLFNAVNNPRGEALAIATIGSAQLALGKPQSALKSYQRALCLFQTVGDQSGEATMLTNIGAVWAIRGKQRKALKSYEQALILSRAVGDKSGESVACHNVGMAYQSLGDLDRAIEHIERCVQLDVEIKHLDLERDQHTLEQLRRERAKKAQTQ